MITAYAREGGMWPPDNESLLIEVGGRFSMWRSVTAGVPFGRFEGRLARAEAEQISREAEAAAGVGGLEHPPEEDAAVETIEVMGTRATMGHDDQPDGPWGKLVEHLRRLLDQLTDQPRAAVGVEIFEGGRAARLVHLGEESLRVDFTEIAARARLLEEGVIDEWRASPEVLAEVSSRGEFDVGRGWTLDLPFEHGFELKEGRRIRARVELRAYEGDVPVVVSVTSPAATI
ncbi:MAG TPA: hypothetical protein VGS09_03260 [Actinomycetota bacterium]|nr:hypothetical protein [Actinomycetota bacterium]